MARQSLVLGLWILLQPAVAHGGPAFEYRASIGAGSSWLDPTLADYRWELDSHLQGFVEGEAARGPWSLALRFWRGGTSQGSGIPGEPGPDVRLTGSELIARYRVLRIGGTEFSAGLGGGRLHVGYSPDSLMLQPQGAPTPIRVDFEPLNEWSVMVGLVVEQRLPHSMALGLHVERLEFSLDTAHRNGGNIEERRERFGNWMGRLSLTRSFGGQ